MEKEKLIKLLNVAYKWGRDNGSQRSEKNFNDLLETTLIQESINQPQRGGNLLNLLEEKKSYYQNPGPYMDDEYYIRFEAKAEAFEDAIELVKTLKQ